MFFHIKDKADRIINLDSVSSIAILNDTNRVVFNLAYACTMSSMGTKKDNVEIADYIYWDNYDQDTLDKLLATEYMKQNFITLPNYNRLINKKHIASIKFDNNRRRVIVNIKCSIRLHPGADLSSDFLFIDANDEQHYNDIKNIIMGLTQE